MTTPTPVFNVGDKVAVHPERTYFSTLGKTMTVTSIETVDTDDDVFLVYHTDYDDPVHGAYNDFELVAVK